MKRAMLIGLALGLLAACGDDKPADLGEVCDVTMRALCDRMRTCNQSSDDLACFNLAMKSCCVGNTTCGNAVREGVTLDDVDACAAALRASSCSDLAAGLLPSACLSW